MRSAKNQTGQKIDYLQQARPPRDYHLGLIEIDLARRPDNRLILGSLESFRELLVQQLGFAFLFFSAFAKHSFAPGPFLCKQLSGVINVGDFGFPGWLAMPNHFAE
jgi:hypothetical protein